jgi:hypothetical protein
MSAWCDGLRGPKHVALLYNINKGKSCVWLRKFNIWKLSLFIQEWKQANEYTCNAVFNARAYSDSVGLAH